MKAMIHVDNQKKKKQEKLIKEIKSSKRKTQTLHDLDFNKHFFFFNPKPVNMF